MLDIRVVLLVGCDAQLDAQLDRDWYTMDCWLQSVDRKSVV